MNARSKWLTHAWLIVALLWFVGCLNYLDRIMITTMRGSLQAAIPMSDAQFGLLTSVFLWVYALLSPFAGFLADRVGRSRIIIASLFVWSLLMWLTGHAKTFDQLLLARALMGISEACYIPAALALIADYHRGPTRSLANGVHLTGTTVGSALSGVGGWLAETYSWNFGFNLFGIVGICYALFLMFVLRDGPCAEGEASARPTAENKIRMGEAIVSLFSRGSFLLACVYWGLLGLAGWAVVGWLPTYLNEQFHLSQGKAGLSATGYVYVAAIAGLLLGGFWADRWSRTNEQGRIFVPMLGLCIAAPAILLAASTSLLGFAVAGLVCFGLARAFTDANMMPILCLVSDPRYRATGYGILNLFGCAVGGGAIYAGGALRDAHVDPSRIFQFAAASLALCAMLLLFIRPTHPAAGDQETASIEPQGATY
jgi:MFS family permease